MRFSHNFPPFLDFPHRTPVIVHFFVFKYIFLDIYIKVRVIQFFDRGLLSLEILAKRGSRKILYALAASKMGMNFTELKKLTGNPTTTSQRLQELTKLGILERSVQADRFRSVRYSLTEKGIRVVRLMRELEKVLV